MLQEYQQLLVEEMLPYQIEILEQGGALDMIRRAAGYRVPERTEPGRPTDVGKLLEATAYAPASAGRSGAEKKAGRADRTAGTGPVRGWLPASHYAGVRPSDRFLSCSCPMKCTLWATTWRGCLPAMRRWGTNRPSAAPEGSATACASGLERSRENPRLRRAP